MGDSGLGPGLGHSMILQRSPTIYRFPYRVGHDPSTKKAFHVQDVFDGSRWRCSLPHFPRFPEQGRGRVPIRQLFRIKTTASGLATTRLINN